VAAAAAAAHDGGDGGGGGGGDGDMKGSGSSSGDDGSSDDTYDDEPQAEESMAGTDAMMVPEAVKKINAEVQQAVKRIYTEKIRRAPCLLLGHSATALFHRAPHTTPMRFAQPARRGRAAAEARNRVTMTYLAPQHSLNTVY
jgi:hypothetical protein